jgi:hypothetical protein
VIKKPPDYVRNKEYVYSFVWRHQRKRHRCTWENNIKLDVRDLRFDNVRQMEVA